MILAGETMMEYLILERAHIMYYFYSLCKYWNGLISRKSSTSVELWYTNIIKYFLNEIPNPKTCLNMTNNNLCKY